MKLIMKYFMVGLATLTPIFVTVYVVIWAFRFMDQLTGSVISSFGGSPLTIPGIGIILSLVIIILIGMATSTWLGQILLRFVDSLFQRLPGIRLIYTVIKDTIQAFYGNKRSFSKVALVTIPGSEMKLIGFVTAEELSSLGEAGEGHVAVYILQSMQWAGFTLLVPKEDVQLIDAKMEDAMKFVISAGMTGK
jgi:uncharacterized membrane protein